MNLLSGVDQDHHREQTSPGAYEWWHFDGTDEKTGFSFSIQFFAGNLLSAYYQDNLKTYWQKTKSPLSPEASAKGDVGVLAPNPLDHCGVTFRVFHKDRMVGEALEEYSHSSLKASDHQSAVLLGPNRFNWDANGDPPSYVLTVQAPQRGQKRLLRARLFFTPETVPIPSLPSPAIPSTHTWALSAPVCHVEGTLQWCDAVGEVEREQGFVGKGYHDHHWGSVPLERFVRAWHWGRAFVGERTAVYSVQVPEEKEAIPVGILLIFKNGKLEIAERDIPLQFQGNRRNFFWLPYQKRVSFPGPFPLTFDHTSILSDGPVSLVMKDKVSLRTIDGSTKGAGLSNYLYAPRLSNSLFFPMLKGKTALYHPAERLSLPPEDGNSDVSTTRPTL